MFGEAVRAGDLPGHHVRVGPAQVLGRPATVAEVEAVEVAAVGELDVEDVGAPFDVPQGPGLGLEPDQDVIRDYRIEV